MQMHNIRHRNHLLLLPMLHHHVLYFALRFEAVYRFEQQFSHSGGVVHPGGLFKLLQQPLDIAPWQGLRRDRTDDCTGSPGLTAAA